MVPEPGPDGPIRLVGTVVSCGDCPARLRQPPILVKQVGRPSRMFLEVMVVEDVKGQFDLIVVGEHLQGVRRRTDLDDVEMRHQVGFEFLMASGGRQSLIPGRLEEPGEAINVAAELRPGPPFGVRGVPGFLPDVLVPAKDGIPIEPLDMLAGGFLVVAPVDEIYAQAGDPVRSVCRPMLVLTHRRRRQQTGMDVACRSTGQ